MLADALTAEQIKAAYDEERMTLEEATEALMGDHGMSLGEAYRHLGL